MSDKTHVPVAITLRLPDGREFTCHEDCLAEHADGMWYWWTEGNGGCDCNRSLSLNRAHKLGLGDPNGEHCLDERCLPCGDTITLVALSVDGVEQRL